MISMRSFVISFNLGNYQNEVIGIELEIEAGEKAQAIGKRLLNF